jgi:hypothetical protein
MLGWLQVQRNWSNSQHRPGLPCDAMRAAEEDIGQL